MQHFVLFLHLYNETVNEKQSALTDTDLNDLIRRCLKKDVVAQKRLYGAYAPKMLALCIRYMGDREAGMDVLQDGL